MSPRPLRADADTCRAITPAKPKSMTIAACTAERLHRLAGVVTSSVASRMPARALADAAVRMVAE